MHAGTVQAGIRVEKFWGLPGHARVDSSTWSQADPSGHAKINMEKPGNHGRILADNRHYGKQNQLRASLELTRN